MNNKAKAWGLATRAVHHPQVRPESEPVAPPLYASVTYRLQDLATGLRYEKDSVHPPSYYGRYGSPTVEAWEKAMADLEGGEKGLAFSSGMAAISTTLYALLCPEEGDHVVAGKSLYSDAVVLLNRDLRRLGLGVDFIDPSDPENFARAANERTRLFYLESIDNPQLSLTDLAAVARIARDRGILTIVDNTFATPVNVNPLAMGASAVIHSATKYLGGHADVLAGCVVSSADIIEKIWHKQLRLGGCLDPHAAWLLLRSLKTLALRMERQSANALIIARHLEQHSKVARVMYPGLESHPQHLLAQRQMRGAGGMVSFELTGGRAAASKLLDHVELAILAVSLGAVETLIESVALSHGPMSDEELRQAGISPGLVRLSVGIEDVTDLIADLDQALAGV